MNIERAVLFVREDEEWVTKLLIAAAMGFFSFLILPAFILTGYSIEVARNVRDGVDVPLPRWDDWGKLLREGFVVAVALLIYSLPIIVLAVLIVIVAATTGSSDLEGVRAIGGTLGILVGCIAALYAVLLMVLSPAIYIQYIREGTLGATLRFSEVIALTRSQLGNIVIAVLVIIGLSMVIGFVSLVLNIVPCLGQIAFLIVSIVTGPYIQIVAGHLFGQVAALVDGGKGDKYTDFAAS